MIDFEAFENLACAAFPDLNISALIYRKGSGKDLKSVRFRLAAEGAKLREKLTAEADSATGAVDSLRRAVQFHCRGNDTDDVLKQLAKINPCLTDDELDAARHQLTACYLADFDKVTAKLLKAATAASVPGE